jgi:murein DD-endopeptidase
MKRTSRRFALIGVPVLALLATGCAMGPTHSPADPQRQPVALNLGRQIIHSAMGQLGVPYRFGGDGPDAFDCSGLVRFVHAAHGVRVPRTTTDQHLAARPVPMEQIAPGDVLFFRFEGPKVSHVALYAGDGRIVHAPQSGRPVELRALDAWYRQRLVGAGRLYE